ncbi:MAG TPA: RICIN domain-containing protein, partial [Candidatus Acidoferrum sp.]|nr:RICIN domain-containing protein [Candidatus Acidoferrum sp.]
NIITNGSFETATVAAYTASFGSLPTNGVSGWTFGSSISGGDAYDGIATGTGGFLQAAGAENGTNAAFIQGTGSISQTVTLNAGTYALTFYSMGRIATGTAEPIAVAIAGLLVTNSPSNIAQNATNDWTLNIYHFAVATAGTYTLNFAGTIPFSSSDHMTLIDNVSIVPVPLAAPYDIVFCGDSITYGATLPDPATEASAVQCVGSLNQRSNMAVSMSNQGFPGHTSYDWLPSTNSSSDFQLAIAAAESLESSQPGQLVFSIMLGANDSGHSISATSYQQNLQSIISQFLSNYPSAFICIHYPIWYTNTENNALSLEQSYFPKIDQLVANNETTYPGHVLAGDKGTAFNYFSSNYLNALTAETGANGTFYLHPNITGAIALGQLWANAIANIITTNTATISNGKYSMFDVPGYVLDDPASGGAGTGTIQSNYYGGTEQQWNISNVSGNQYKITCFANGLALSGTTSSAQLTMQSYTGAANQLWTLVPNGSFYNIINVGTGQAMDDWGGYPAGTVGQYSASPSNGNQFWRLTPATNLITVGASNANLQYRGRINFTNALAPVLYWAGSEVAIAFQGSQLAANLVGSEGAMTVVIDGGSPEIINFNPSATTYILASGLANTSHTAHVVRNNDYSYGNVTFNGFLITGVNPTVLTLPAKPPRRIEFYGDSITSGVAAGPNGSDDNYYAYSGDTARDLGADYTCISRGCIGLVHSGCGLTETMPTIYNLISPFDTNSLWTFSSWKPDVVIVDLGENDEGGNPPASTMISAYTTFLGTLRTKYPNAWIIAALGSMDVASQISPYPGYIATAVAQLNDPKIVNYTFSTYSGHTHPNTLQAQAMANELEVFINKAVGWTLPVPNGAFNLVDAAGYYLADPASGGAGTGLIQYTSTGGQEQQWNFTQVSASQYKITCVVNGLALSGTSPTAQLTLQNYTATPNQLWSFTPNGSSYNIINIGTGQAIDEYGGYQAGTVGQYWVSFHNSINQQWTLIPAIANGTYNIINQTSGFALDDPNGGGSGSGTDQQPPVGANQQWIATAVGGGYYKITSAVNGLALSGPNSYAQLILQSVTGTNYQLWSFVPNGSYYVISNAGSSQVIDDFGQSTNAGNTIGQWNANSQSNQNWALISIAPPSPPTGLRALSTGNPGNQVNLSWNASEGATSYNVKRSTTIGNETTIANVNKTSYIDTNVINGTKYYYEISAINSYGESTNSSELSIISFSFPVATAQELVQNYHFASGATDWSSWASNSWEVNFSTGNVNCDNNATVWQDLNASIQYGASYKMTAVAQVAYGTMDGIILSFDDVTAGWKTLVSTNMAFPAGDQNPTTTGTPSSAAYETFTYVINWITLSNAISSTSGANVGDKINVSLHLFENGTDMGWVNVYWVSLEQLPTPDAPVLQLRMPFTNDLGNATTVSDPSNTGLNITMNMSTNGSAGADLISASGFGVTNLNVNARALDLTTNMGGTQPGGNGSAAGPVVNLLNNTTLTNLGYNGVISNFTVTFWMKQKVGISVANNTTPCLFILNAGSSGNDWSAGGNTMGMDETTTTNLAMNFAGFTLIGTTATAIPSNQWVFEAVTYDGTNFNMYYGGNASSVTQIGANSSAGRSVNLDSAASLTLGNRGTDFWRNFDGWLEDFRIYNGAGNSNFVENVRATLAPLPGQQPHVVFAPPSQPQITGIGLNGATLTISAANASPGTTYHLLSSTNMALPLSQWTPLLTNVFDANGNLKLSTNIIDSSDARRFYILRVH